MTEKPGSAILRGMKRFCLLLLFVGIALLLARCGKNTPAPGTFTAVYTNTLSTACIQCHQPSGSAASSGATLDFSSQTKAYNTLKSKVTSTSLQSGCGTLSNVNPGDPSTSFVTGMIFQDYYKSNFGVTGCTPDQGHLGFFGAISPDEESSLIQWIQNGALNN